MNDPIPADYIHQMADLASNHIEGIAAMGMTPFACPLISHVEDTLWQGGTPADAHDETGRPIPLPAFFTSVLNLYPWVSYEYDQKATAMRTERLYDAGAVPPRDLLYELADWVNEQRKRGPTLVHCQAGLNRSALVTGLALVVAGRTPDAAIDLLRERRSPAVLCNTAFEGWLRTQG